MANVLAIKSPSLDANAARYDSDCQDALAGATDNLLDQAGAAGWDRIRAASASLRTALSFSASAMRFGHSSKSWSRPPQ
ncbi:MAG: hypothetical protein EKK31_16020 [Hyphomicrobiales bacterium]|nr:MAG: hypothetical protein EKK31_16020 [Hyphomicrobiales bacterium]